MQQLLTGKTRLEGFSNEWHTKKLGEIAHINMGQSPDSKNYNVEGIGMPLIQGNADIENRKSISRVWTTQITKTCNEGDLIMTVRAPVGSIGVATKNSCLGRGVCSLKPIKDNHHFIFYLMTFLEEKWKGLEQGSTFTSANSSHIAEFSLSITDSIEEQTAIATILSDMDVEIVTLERKRDKTRALKQAMMQELLTGRTRLL
jgi:type I restriction enzyme S subunit